jgi:hypothetical protein
MAADDELDEMLDNDSVSIPGRSTMAADEELDGMLNNGATQFR